MTVLFTAGNYHAGFILTDLRLLRTLDSVEILPATRLPDVWNKIRKIPHADIVYGWFADLPNLATGVLCRLLRKRFILAVAGYELANLPEIDYGLQRRALSRMVVRRCFHLASKLTFLHEGLRAEAAEFDPLSIGKMVVVPPGYDASFWTPGDGGNRRLVTSVMTTETVPRFRVKGGPVVLELARRFPTVPFVLVGVKPEVSRVVSRDLPSNVKVETVLSSEELRRLYQESISVLQPSVREVFPNAVCEAMLCGALPVVSPLPVMREVVGDAGFVAADASIESYAYVLKEALAGATNVRRAAREWIQTRFPLEGRLRAIQVLLSRDSSDNPP